MPTLTLTVAPACGQRAHASRLIVMRGASDYCYAPDGVADGAPLAGWFFDRNAHFFMNESLRALVLVGSPVLQVEADAGFELGEQGQSIFAVGTVDKCEIQQRLLRPYL